jgi:hypothetical protein
VKAKRALIRSVEKQVEMSDEIDMLKAQTELGFRPPTPTGLRSSAPPSAAESPKGSDGGGDGGEARPPEAGREGGELSPVAGMRGSCAWSRNRVPKRPVLHSKQDQQ